METSGKSRASFSERRRMQWDTVVGFLTFFAVVAVIQAVRNVLQPQPEVLPAFVALVLVVAAVSAWRYGRTRR
ncbi:membrane protein [Corynebacterium aquilae DSM 44791]|uniref:Membrane protein n=1 Tax=Corynebacterium aquilae DSM 44791 TaxID=1431546 RepID=A0A1L7CEC6_9CORY|nr:membrane protein [Corynebacterium aquilae DSM 44791]